MPRPKVAMRRIKEVLRLKEGLGLSDIAVSRRSCLNLDHPLQYTASPISYAMTPGVPSPSSTLL